MSGLVYDVGALRAAGSGAPAGAALWRLHRGALRRGETPLVIAPVLAAANGSGQLAALLAGCALVDFPISAAWDVRRLLARCPGADLVAAAVVLAALASRCAVVTTAPRPLEALAAALDVHLPLAVL